MDYILLGENIRKERKTQGLTLENLAEKAEIGENFLGKIERGDSIPSLRTVSNIAQALNVGIDHLIGDTLHKSEYKLLNVIVEMNKLSKLEKEKFIDFINSTIKYFKN